MAFGEHDGERDAQHLGFALDDRLDRAADAVGDGDNGIDVPSDVAPVTVVLCAE
ncbi:hypothetical protein GCM10009642_45210 [Nocardiopsis metallicus]